MTDAEGRLFSVSSIHQGDSVGPTVVMGKIESDTIIRVRDVRICPLTLSTRLRFLAFIVLWPVTEEELCCAECTDEIGEGTISQLPLRHDRLLNSGNRL